MANIKTKKKDRKRPVNYIDMGQWPVYVGVARSKRDFNREMKRLKIKNPPNFMPREGANGVVHAFTHKGEKLLLIIGVDFKDERCAEAHASLVAHEALHCVQYIRREINNGDPFDDETEAYMLQLIVLETLIHGWNTGNDKLSIPS